MSDHVMTAIGLGKRYRRRWALSDCDLEIPAHKVVGLVGPNGAGKSTLLNLAVGLIAPTSGTIEVLGGRPGVGAEQLARVGFVAQDTPTYASLTVADHLRFGSWMNPGWDAALAARRVDRLGLDPRRRTGRLSGGQRAQLALALAVAKRPELLILDEPVAALDPLARREFLVGLADVVAEQGVSVVLSSHLVADLEQVCDHLVVLVGSRVRLAGDISGLVAARGGGLEELVLDADVRSDRGAVMIRVALRQFRTQALVAAVGVAALAVVVLLTRPHLVDVYDANVAGCSARGTCDSAIPDFLDVYRTLRGWLGVVVAVTPGLIGVFWGAPLVAREVEAGTFRLAWTQSVTRTRWLAAQLGVVGLAAVVTTGLVSLLVTWWASLPDKVGEDVYATFDLRGVAPVGHALLGFVLGVTAGVILRKLLTAMGTTLVAFVGVRLAFVSFVRPRLPGGRHLELPLDATQMGFGRRNLGPMNLMPEPPRLPNAWFHSVDVVDASGTKLPTTVLADVCPKVLDVGPPRGVGPGGNRQVPDGVKDVMRTCVDQLSATYHTAVSYHPAGRYWALQWMELGISVGAALLLGRVQLVVAASAHRLTVGSDQVPDAFRAAACASALVCLAARFSFSVLPGFLS